MIGRPSAHKRAPGPSGFQRERQYKCSIKSKNLYISKDTLALVITLRANGTTAPSPFVPSLTDMNDTVAEGAHLFHTGTLFVVVVVFNYIAQT